MDDFRPKSRYSMAAINESHKFLLFRTHSSDDFSKEKTPSFQWWMWPCSPWWHVNRMDLRSIGRHTINMPNVPNLRIYSACIGSIASKSTTISRFICKKWRFSHFHGRKTRFQWTSEKPRPLFTLADPRPMCIANVTPIVRHRSKQIIVHKNIE